VGVADSGLIINCRDDGEVGEARRTEERTGVVALGEEKRAHPEDEVIVDKILHHLTLCTHTHTHTQ
jgi:hypothetical protein